MRPFFQAVTGKGMTLPGTAGNYMSTPDSVLNSVTGDIDIRVLARATDWTPAADMSIFGKLTTTGNQRSYRIYIDATNGSISFAISTDGITSHTVAAWASAGTFVDGQAYWIRGTFDVDDGAGSHVGRIYTSADGITWILRSTITGVGPSGVWSIFDSTAPLEVGSINSGAAQNFNGDILYAEVRNGIDGPVVSKFDASTVNVTGTTSPATIPGWTVNGTAVRKYEDHVYIPGVGGNNLSHPKSSTALTGLDVRVKLAADDWTPASFARIIGQYGGAGTRIWYLGLNTDGSPSTSISANGTTETFGGTTVFGFADGSVQWLRYTWVPGGPGVIYKSADGVTWTLHSTNTQAAAGMFDVNTAVTLGTDLAGTGNLFKGKIYYAEVRNGIDGPVVYQFDARDIATPWTIAGSGWTWAGANVARKPVTALSLPGTSGNYASTPDSLANSITGDIDIRAKLTLTEWTRPSGANQNIISKWATQRAYRLMMGINGYFTFSFSLDGSTQLANNATAVAPFANGTTGWVRATRTTAGASNFYTSVDGVAWTPLGNQVNGTAGALFDSSAVLETSRDGGSDPIGGTLHYAEVRSGIDGPVVALFDASTIARTGTRTPTTTVNGGSPNLLTPNQASIETDTTGWQTGNANTTIARSTAQFLDGAASLELTAVAIGKTLARTVTGLNGKPVVAGKSYTAILSMRAAVTGRATQVFIDWYDSAGAYVSSIGSLSTDTNAGWTVATVSAKAPATAAFAAVAASVEDAAQPAAEVHYVDRISLTETPYTWTVAGSAWDWVPDAAAASVGVGGGNAAAGGLAA